MRLRSWVVAIAALLTATAAMADNGYPPRTGGNYSGPRWYGYFYNNGHVAENADHTNITMIGAPELNKPQGTQTGDQQGDATTVITDELKIDKPYGIQAMVDVEAIVFVETGAKRDTCYDYNPTAVQDFQTFVQTLIDGGYLVPNHPELSTVSSFYVADEPDRSCGGALSDDPFPPHTANLSLVNAISAIRQNPNTTNFPLATIVTKDNFGYMPEGISLFDWVGEDDYGSGDVSTYLSDFAAFEYISRHNDWAGGTPQLYFLVPLVSLGPGIPYSNGAPALYNEFVADNRVIGIMPFEWDFNGGGMVGYKWAPSYIALGQSIAPAKPLLLADITVIVDYVVLQ